MCFSSYTSLTSATAASPLLVCDSSHMEIESRQGGEMEEGGGIGRREGERERERGRKGGGKRKGEILSNTERGQRVRD